MARMPLPRLFWIVLLALLGGLYAGWAWAWPALFHREILRHGRPVEAGFQLGRAIYWRLPGRRALALALLAGLPAAAAIWLPEMAANVLLAAAAAGHALLWLTFPPGRRWGLIEHGAAGGAPLIEMRPAGGWLRALAVFLGCGLLPAALGAAALTLR